MLLNVRKICLTLDIPVNIIYTLYNCNFFVINFIL